MKGQVQGNTVYQRQGFQEDLAMHGKVEICGVNTAKLKVLSNDEITELLRRTKEGDMEARQELISGNLRLVLSVIQKFLSRGENVDDLFQVGCIGLIKAIDNFDISQNVRFSTYGVPTVIVRGKVGVQEPGKALKTLGFHFAPSFFHVPCMVIAW